MNGRYDQSRGLVSPFTRPLHILSQHCCFPLHLTAGLAFPGCGHDLSVSITPSLPKWPCLQFPFSCLPALTPIVPCQMFSLQNIVKTIALCILGRKRMVFVITCLVILFSHADGGCYFYLMCAVNKWFQTRKEKN